MRPEAKVGLFIVIGLLALFALSTRAGDFKVANEEDFFFFVTL